MGNPTAPGTQAWKAIQEFPDVSVKTDSPPGPATPGPLDRIGFALASLHGPSGPVQVATPTGVVGAVPVVAREEEVVGPTRGDEVGCFDGAVLPRLVRHQQWEGSSRPRTPCRRGQLLRPDLGGARTARLPDEVGRAVGVDERGRVDGAAQRLLALSGAVDLSLKGPWGWLAVATEMHSSPVPATSTA